MGVWVKTTFLLHGFLMFSTERRDLLKAERDILQKIFEESDCSIRTPATNGQVRAEMSLNTENAAAIEWVEEKYGVQFILAQERKLESLRLNKFENVLPRICLEGMLEFQVRISVKFRGPTDLNGFPWVLPDGRDQMKNIFLDPTTSEIKPKMGVWVKTAFLLQGFLMFSAERRYLLEVEQNILRKMFDESDSSIGVQETNGDVLVVYPCRSLSFIFLLIPSIFLLLTFNYFS